MLSSRIPYLEEFYLYDWLWWKRTSMLSEISTPYSSMNWKFKKLSQSAYPYGIRELPQIFGLRHLLLGNKDIWKVNSKNILKIPHRAATLKAAFHATVSLFCVLCSLNSLIAVSTMKASSKQNDSAFQRYGNNLNSNLNNILITLEYCCNVRVKYYCYAKVLLLPGIAILIDKNEKIFVSLCVKSEKYALKGWKYF
jgi:hypothetical protein